MKHIPFIILTTIALCLSTLLFQHIPNRASDNKKPAVLIDTVKIDEIVLDNICFTVNESSYPKVTELNDQTFEDRLNKMFSSNFNAFIDSAKHIYGGCLTKEEIEASGSWEGEFGYANGSFETLTQKDNIISIIQHFEGGHNKAWNPYSITINCNYKNKTFYNNADFRKMLNNDSEFINKKIKEYFNQWLSEFFGDDKEQIGFRDDYLSYLYITDKKELNQLKFGIRNDSIMLVMEAEPTGTKDSYATYIIPIDKCKNIH